jgi:hypothetical protein
MADLRESQGTITFLRVHDDGGFGPPTDRIDGEVIMKLNSDPNLAVGFQLRNDGSRPAHQGMLDLLRDAFNNNWTVVVDYFIDPGKFNGTAFRIALVK